MGFIAILNNPSSLRFLGEGLHKVGLGPQARQFPDFPQSFEIMSKYKGEKKSGS